MSCLLGCGGGATEDPSAAFQAGDYSTAKSGFEQVLADAGADDTTKYRACRDLVVCEAKLGNEAAATSVFSKLKDGYSSHLDINNLAKLGRDLAASGCPQAATEVITVATDMAKSDAEKAPLQELAQMIAESGDADVLEQLRALGYIGN